MKGTLRKIFSSYIKTVWIKKFIFILFSWVFVAFITILEPLIFTQIIKKIEEFYITWVFDFPDFINYIIFWWIFIIFIIIIQYSYDYFLRWKTLVENYSEMNKIYSEKIINMSYNEYLWKKQWNLYKIFDRWVDQQYMFLNSFFSEYIKWISSILFVIIILFSIDIKMTLIALSMLPIMIFLWIFFIKSLSPAQKEIDQNWESIYWKTWDILNNFTLVKTLVLEPLFLNNIKNKLDSLFLKQLKLTKYWWIVNIYSWVLVMISRILVIWFWTYFIINWTLTLATLFLFFSYIGWIYFPLSFIFSNLRNLTQQLTAIWKLHEEFDDLEKENILLWKKLESVKWKIEYNNVKFHYNKTNNILDNINFKIHPWQKVAFVWSTWSWKSTIINLLLRFWDIKKWEILLDWENINNISKKYLRKHIWVVSQDNSLFNTSIKENLLFAKKNASIIELNNALKKAEANFVFDLKNWLDTIIWERWLKLSWWEKQRLSIAMLFLRNPEILILDEATSALDNKTEKLVQKALDKLMKWRTSIIIAHRLTTIQHADNIFVIEKWKILEKWNYEELISKKWKFYDLASVDNLILS